MIKHVIWSSMIDYPGKTCAVLFTGACNFKCGFCYNKTLNNQDDMNFEESILPKLLSRKDFVDHVIISGGEPTIDPDFDKIINLLYHNGFTIGIHTNGSNPDIVERNIDKISYFGVDIKTSKVKYNNIVGITFDTKKLEETIKLILENNKDYEFRTTLFPKEVDVEDVIKIAKWLKENNVKHYHLQQYYPVNGAEVVKQYSLEEITLMQQECNKILPTILKTK